MGKTVKINRRTATSTIKDVAHLAGVTPGTVSLALNRDPHELNFNKETIHRIHEAAKKLHYKPNAHASRLAKRAESRPTVVVMTPTAEGIGGSHNQDVLSGIIEAATRLSVNVILRATIFGADRLPAVHSIGNPIVLDGVLLHTWFTFPDEVIEELVLLDKPFVLANHYVDNPQIPCVGGDMSLAGEKVAGHLLRLRHTNIVAMLGPAICKVTNYLAGIRREMESVGLELPDSKVRFGSYESLNRQALFEFMQLRPRPTAIICMDDASALSTIGALTEMGIRVPKDISVIGFGNESFSALMHPQLTTVNELGKTIGNEAMAMLMALIDDKALNTKVNLAFDVIPRETTAPPPKEN